MLSHFTNIDPVILLFALGLLASWVKSDLEIPEPISKFLSILLLLSIGIKGGHEIRTAHSYEGLLPILGIGLLSCLAIPTIMFFAIRRRLGVADAAALASCYGSVSAVTFIVAQSLLEEARLSTSGFMVAVMAFMEIPAIIVGLALYKRYSLRAKHPNSSPDRVLTAKSVVLLVGGVAVGLLMNDRSWPSIQPLVQGSFKGFLMIFLLDLGLAAQKHLRPAFQAKAVSLFVGCALPILHGISTLILASLAGVKPGDAVLLATLAGSASYIAAPAAIRSGIPEAKPSFYVTLPLALTFPMNVLFGIPLYMLLAEALAK